MAVGAYSECPPPGLTMDPSSNLWKHFRLTYQPPTNSIFLSHQINTYNQPINNDFPTTISTSHQAAEQSHVYILTSSCQPSCGQIKKFGQLYIFG
jgi:hypothetical protein